MSSDTVPTGTLELDRVLGGGFPPHSLISLSGNPGTGKTILSTHFLYHGSRRSIVSILVCTYGQELGAQNPLY
jgi:KaiC/GvpD/RAD55 family RecA-like ATPase